MVHLVSVLVGGSAGAGVGPEPERRLLIIWSSICVMLSSLRGDLLGDVLHRARGLRDHELGRRGLLVDAAAVHAPRRGRGR